MQLYITSVGESVQLFSRLAQAALATLIYPVKIVDERSLLRLFNVPRRVVNRREDSLDREGGCVHKCAAIHRNLCCIANRILSLLLLLLFFFIYFFLLFLLFLLLFLLLLREQYLLAVMKTGYHASASRSLSCVKGILEITNNLNAVCLSLRTFTWAVYELWGGKKIDWRVTRVVSTKRDDFYRRKKNDTADPFPYVCPAALSIFASRTNGRGEEIGIMLWLMIPGQLMDLLTHLALGNYIIQRSF